MKDAFRNNFDSGSTAAIILMAENQIFAANIGDSKAFVCSEDYKSSTEARGEVIIFTSDMS